MWLTAAVLSFGLLGADPQGAAPQPEVKPEAKADAQPEAKAPAKEAAPNRVRAMGPRHVQPRHHAHQENGRIWVSRPFIGPGPSHPVLNCENPGPAAYGAHEGDRSRVVVRVGSATDHDFALGADRDRGPPLARARARGVAAG